MSKENCELECGAFGTYCKCNDEAKASSCNSDLLERKFPVLSYDRYKDCPSSVKWSELDDAWALNVHSQTLERLAQRGGLCPEEIYWNVNHLQWSTKVDEKAALDLVKRIAF